MGSDANTHASNNPPPPDRRGDCLGYAVGEGSLTSSAIPAGRFSLFTTRCANFHSPRPGAHEQGPRTWPMVMRGLRARWDCHRARARRN